MGKPPCLINRSQNRMKSPFGIKRVNNNNIVAHAQSLLSKACWAKWTYMYKRHDEDNALTLEFFTTNTCKDFILFLLTGTLSTGV